jgi:hypothetical protein
MQQTSWIYFRTKRRAHFFESAFPDTRAAVGWRLKAENWSVIAEYAPKDIPAAGATLNRVNTQPLNRPFTPSFFKVLLSTRIALSYLRKHQSLATENNTQRTDMFVREKRLTFRHRANRWPAI